MTKMVSQNVAKSLREYSQKLKIWAKTELDPNAPQWSNEEWRDRMPIVIDLLAELGPVVDLLLCWKPTLVEPLREKGTKLMSSAREVLQTTATGFEYSVLVTDFRCEISNFVDRLLHIGDMAREERNKAKHHRIKATLVGFVIFFAALLTIFHHLGWLEQIKVFIYNVLRLK